EAAGAPGVRISPGGKFAFSVDPIVRAIDAGARLGYLTGPNNPTGLAISHPDLLRIVGAGGAAGGLVVIDEAEVDCSGRSFVDALEHHRHVVVGRTFAKAHGLAALRAGAIVAHPDALARMRSILPPFNLNIAAARALLAALSDRAYLDWYRDQSVQSRDAIYA